MATSGSSSSPTSVWISALGIHYKLGLDGLNVLLILITTIVFAAAILYAAGQEWDRPRIFYLQFALAESAVLGAFCAQDLALFVVFFDLMLIPFYFLSGIWGGEDRIRATTKLVIYTLVGSFLMLVAAVATGVLASSEHHTPITFVLSQLQAPAALAHLAGVDLRLASRSRSWSRCRWSRSTAGCPTGTRRCRSRRSRCSRGSCRRSPPTASCGSCCRCSRTRRSTSRR